MPTKQKIILILTIIVFEMHLVNEHPIASFFKQGSPFPYMASAYTTKTTG